MTAQILSFWHDVLATQTNYLWFNFCPASSASASGFIWQACITECGPMQRRAHRSGFCEWLSRLARLFCLVCVRTIRDGMILLLLILSLTRSLFTLGEMQMSPAWLASTSQSISFVLMFKASAKAVVVKSLIIFGQWPLLKGEKNVFLGSLK